MLGLTVCCVLHVHLRVYMLKGHCRIAEYRIMYISVKIIAEDFRPSSRQWCFP